MVKIDTVENGLACGCVCAKCGAALVARNNGKERSHHFAHHNSEDCAGAFETALHLLAKQVFEKEKAFVTPDVYHTNFEIEYRDKIYSSKKIVFERVVLERKVTNADNYFIPDAIGFIGENKIFIEFAHTHLIDEIKLEKIKQSGIPCIEVYLLGTELDETSIRELLFSNDHKKWISYPQLEKQADIILVRKKAEIDRIKAQEKEIKLERARLKKAQIQEKFQNYSFDREIELFQKKDFLLKCPLYQLELNKLKESDFYEHKFLARIINGEFWNGRFYPDKKYSFSNGTWIFLKNEKIYIYPPDDCKNTWDKGKSGFFWKGLNTIISLRDKYYCENCKSCKDLFDLETINYVACAYPKIINP